MKPKVLFLMGPTAAGKTAAAMHIADQFPVELISVDSALIYRHMNIGTAKPTAQELKRYPHQLIDIIDPQDCYSAAQFISDATILIHRAHQNNKTPLLVGGTILYFKALLQGLSKTPSADKPTRDLIRQTIETEGLSAAYEWLHRLDPKSSERLHHNDRQRIERALEIVLFSGQPMSNYYDNSFFTKGWDQSGLAKSPWNILPIIYAPIQKQLLHPIIEQRFINMVHDGFLEEMKFIMSLDNMSLDLPSMRCVGYRQAWLHLTDQINYRDFIEQGQAATRQLAKRQMTWLRNWSTATWVDSFSNSSYERLDQLIHNFLT